MATYTLAIFLVFYDLDTKVLSHSAQGWLWLEWWYCLCLASLSLEVNLSWHLSHSTLSTSLCALALCSRACGWLLKAWPQILHPKAACPSAGSCATSNGWRRLCWNHTGHTRGCTAGHSNWAGPVAFLLPYPAQSLRIVVQFKVWLVWLQHNRHHQIIDASDAALGQAALCLQCSICCQAVGHTTWSTRLLPTVRLRVNCD